MVRNVCPPWLGAVCLLMMASGPAWGETTDGAGAPAPEPTSEGSTTRLEEVVVRGRADSLVGVAESASEGTVGGEQIERRTLSRPGEVLETVPGVIVTQHSGAGKANQYFLRGFNLDHGTDFATSVDGVPVNLPTHGHGQGYTDLNFLIPELVEGIDYRKGVYYADVGDFSSAGSARIHTADVLPRAIAQVEAGLYDYARALVADSLHAGPGNLLYAVELFYDDGPWEHADRFKKGNAVLRYSGGDAGWGYSLTATAYAGDWDSTDQIARRALGLPGFDRFDSLDKSDGGDSQKVMLYGEWHRADESSATKLLAYAFYQKLDLFSDFTYFLASPQGDQFEQTDRRWVGGAKGSQTWFGRLCGFEMENTFGLQLRSDSIDNGLFQTVDRHRTDKLDYDGGTLPATTRRDEVWELNLAPYLESRVQWLDWLRSTLGVRLDYFHFDVDGNRRRNSGTKDDVIASPKASLVFGPWAATELYLSGGLGFHSNDARGVTAPRDPADPLVRSYGAEAGMRTSWLPGLHSTVAVWWLDIDSELLFVGDAGTTEGSRPSRRYGVELANYYEPTSWLTLDADVSISRARFRDHDPAGHEIPGSVETVVAAGATVHDLAGFFGALRLRYFGPRPLIEDDSVRSSSTILMSARVGYQFNPTWALSAEVFNLLDRADSEIDYYYASRLAGEPAGPDENEGGYNDVHFHPVDPISFRLALTARF
jgi:outer membrane cobalamin receptor